MIRKYLRLYGHFIKFAFTRGLQFRANFFIRFTSDVLFYIVNVFFYKIIFSHTMLLADWTFEQTMVFIGTYLFVDAVHMTVLSDSIWHLPGLINKGDLDYYLLRPVSSLFFLTLRDFAASSFMNLVLAFAMLVFFILQLPVLPSPAQFGLYSVGLICGILLYYSLIMLVTVPSFWIASPHGFHMLFWSFTRLGERPDRIFTGATKWILRTVLPFSLIASFPARLFVEGFQWPVLLNLVLVTLVFFGLLLWLWQRGLRAYSSASS